MNLARHAAVLWRFRAVAAAGLALACLLAFLASYSVSLNGVKPRSAEIWSSQSSLLVTQPGFPEGRVTLPTAPSGEPGAAPAVPQPRGDDIEFAGPERFPALANIYAQLLAGDQVRDRIETRPAADQIEALVVEGPNATQLPVIQLTTKAGSASGARELNAETIAALRGLLADEQAKNEIPTKQRVRVDEISAPEAPVLTSGRTYTAGIIAFVLCLLGTIAVVHMLAGLRERQGAERPEGVLVSPFWADRNGAGEPDARPAQASDAERAERRATAARGSR